MWYTGLHDMQHRDMQNRDLLHRRQPLGVGFNTKIITPQKSLPHPFQV